METAVLFLVFNRPETTRRVFEAIRQARPPRLYVAADGPRPSRLGEDELCEEVRKIATAVDWPCELKTLFRASNLGCKWGVSEGITWFFDNEGEGIILEDDVLPLPSFFPYCEELLARYRYEQEVMLISGCNLISSRYSASESYIFSKYNHIWGWASWRRAWSRYDVSMSQWPAFKEAGMLDIIADSNQNFVEYWQDIFDQVHRGEIDTWDYQWTFALWAARGLSIIPSSNLTLNLGFGVDATHTTCDMPEYIRLSTPYDLEFPLKHPQSISRDICVDHLITSLVYRVTRLNAIKRKFRAFPVSAWFMQKLKLIARSTG